ncbi:farnesyl pyrophosphate synthase-like isoform X2 [Mercenaria mercenaria]|uniref:farnesyl pyrophosphate synthase-like isoform X2 n=1 Tax=Mercenaria mercenaria TaxID=6596 RepID=UPI00234E8F0C|nr:farnesyl pyrophosphate synthase-like isoform X2 [Mercenaria mercenaria]
MTTVHQSTDQDIRLTNGCGSDHSGEKKQKMSTDLEQFDEIFPELVGLLVNAELEDPERKDASRWFKEVLEYNVPHGKKNRGMFVVMAYKYLKEQPKEGDIKIARILGWCIELLQAFFLVEDDVMDQSYTRRGQPCWFRKENVGLEAINDGVYLESCIYKILKHYIRDKPYYINIIELFHEITHCTITGQCLDMTVSPPAGTVDFSRYTIEKYNAIVKWKTAFYSFYLPVAIAMYMDDFLDCYGDEAVIGKIGTDIQDNKCSWLVIKALQKASPEQLNLLKENYGSSDETKVVKVKALYKELKLEQEFRDFEESSFQEILELIEKCSGDLPKDMFKAFVQKIYKRNK